MAQIFHRSSNMIARLSIGGAVVFVGALIFILYQIALSPWYTNEHATLRQPVPFSHRHHAGELGIDCRYCHTAVETSWYAGVPPTQTCMTCHSQIWTNAAMLEPVRESYRTGVSLQWNKVNERPESQVFNPFYQQPNYGAPVTFEGVKYTSQAELGPVLVKKYQLQTYQYCSTCHR